MQVTQLVRVVVEIVVITLLARFQICGFWSGRLSVDRPTNEVQGSHNFPKRSQSLSLVSPHTLRVIMTQRDGMPLPTGVLARAGSDCLGGGAIPNLGLCYKNTPNHPISWWNPSYALKIKALANDCGILGVFGTFLFVNPNTFDQLQVSSIKSYKPCGK